MFHTHDPRVLILKRNAQNLYQVETGELHEVTGMETFIRFVKAKSENFDLI